MNRILLTGGNGYIGSHACVELIRQGYKPVIIDNFINSSKRTIKAMEAITQSAIESYEIDLLNFDLLNDFFYRNKFDAVIHFAGLKSVTDSLNNPMQYFNNNIVGTLNLMEAMKKNDVKNLIFSSSATIYGEPESLPIKETHPISIPNNPYGKSKFIIEQILLDLTKSDKSWNIISLRYFNPVGAHSSGLIGEDPVGVPNNLMPFITKVAVGKIKELKIFGNDYNTVDGTGVRDYIHVVDLVLGHIAALKKIDFFKGFNAINLGTGRGYSVLELVNAFSRISGVEIKYSFTNRRSGDLAISYADNSLAKSLLDWNAERDLEAMCIDSWRWQKSHPDGFLSI